MMATQVIAYVPNAGFNYVTLTSWAGNAVFPVTPVAGDQIEYPDGLTVGVDGVVTGADGTYTLRLIKASTGTVYAISYVIGSGVPVPVSATTNFTLLPPTGHAVVTLITGFDAYLFQDWSPGTPAVGWQLVYPTANNTIINSLAEIQTDATAAFDVWAVDLNGTWYGIQIDPSNLAAVVALPATGNFGFSIGMGFGMFMRGGS